MNHALVIFCTEKQGDSPATAVAIRATETEATAIALQATQTAIATGPNSPSTGSNQRGNTTPVPAGYELSPVNFSEGDEKVVPSEQIWICRGPVTAKSGDVLDGNALSTDTFEKTVDQHTDDTYWGEVTTAYPGADLLMLYGGSCKVFRANAPQNVIDSAAEISKTGEATTGCGSACSSGVGLHTIKRT